MKLDGCGCCEGLGRRTPEVIENRPGLSAVAYRIGTHGRFLASMLAKLSDADLPALSELSSRSPSDLSIALLDGWATVADVVAFYAERIANESYLRTATERRSLVELANLIGYLPRPGVAASTYLAFTLEDTGTPDDVPVPAGARVQSVPGPGERPQVFETVEAIAGRPEHNAMRPRLVRRHPPLTPQAQAVTVRGTAAPVRKGDTVLLVCGPSERVLKTVLKVEVDAAEQRVRIDLGENPPQPAPFVFTLLPAATWTITPLKLTAMATATHVLSGSWKQADLKAFASVQKWPLVKLTKNLHAQALKILLAKPQTGVFAMRQRASIFGHSAPKHSTLPDDHKFGSTWEGRTLASEPGASSNAVDLDTRYPGIVDGSWVVLDSPGNRNVRKVAGYSEVTRTDFTLSAKVSRITLDSGSGLASHTIRGTTVHCESEELELAELPITDLVAGDRLVLDRPYLGLSVGRPVAVSGRRADLDGVEDGEVVTIAEIVFNEGYTELRFATALAHQYERASVTVNANVARATHGETKEQALGSGDANVAFQRFALPEAPLTHVPAQTPTGAESTLDVRVNGLLWQEVDFLYGRGPHDHVYITRQDDSGRTHVMFGDGRTGARVPSGQENVRATYRKGMGAEGLVHEGRLTLPMTRPLGVKSVVNPVPATDAADADDLEDLRASAPLPTLTLQRIVSLRDYESFARAFTGIGKALATWTWNGHQRGVYVTIAGADGEQLEQTGPTYTNLLAAMRAAGDPTVPLRVKSYVPAYFRLSGSIAVDPAHQAHAVLGAVAQAVRARFSFHAREFGQPVAKSEVIAAVQAVSGVTSLDLDALHRVDADVDLLDTLPAHTPRAGTDVTLAAELLLLDPRPLQLGVAAA